MAADDAAEEAVALAAVVGGAVDEGGAADPVPLLAPPHAANINIAAAPNLTTRPVLTVRTPCSGKAWAR
jgi:hypothetical protein